jgi:hypothetical protein
MPIKSFTFAFKIDAKDLLAYVVERNIAVDIHATGTKRQEPEPAVLPAMQQPLALPAPHPIAGERKPRNGRLGSKAVILFYLVTHKQAKAHELIAALEEAGYKAATFNSLMWHLKTNKLVSGSDAKGGYHILNKGLKQLDTAEAE